VIKRPVIGIPKWDWKSPLLKHAIKNGTSVSIENIDLCYELKRHLEILNMFDENIKDFSDSNYYKYQNLNGKPHKEVMFKIELFKSLYAGIKKEGMRNAAVVTEDGCRLDGSHRLSISQHLGIPHVNVIIARYEECFKPEKVKRIMKNVEEYRSIVYGF